MLKALLAVFVFAGTAASASTLKCWNTYSKSKVPFFRAEVVDNNTLVGVRILHKNTEVKNTEGKVKGELITSNRSPYKGNNRFQLTNAELTLPVDLSPQALIAKEKTGIGMGKGENGVLIYSSEFGDGAGSHVSIRLRCRNYEN